MEFDKDNTAFQDTTEVACRFDQARFKEQYFYLASI